MPSTILEGQIILRQWDRASGLVEQPQAFSTLGELYALCLKATDPHLLDRIIISGHDDKGQPRVLTFVFQSITVSSKKA